MDRMIFVNLPVADVAAARAFWAALGFSFDERYSGDRSVCVVLGDRIFAMLLDHGHFAEFSALPVSDAFASKEVLTCLSCADPAEVDDLVSRALAAGGKPWKDTFEAGPMYGGSFVDPDGHVWELMSMAGA